MKPGIGLSVAKICMKHKKKKYMMIGVSVNVATA